MLIIEGTDLTGKTTLARTLAESLDDHIYAHFSRLPAGFDFLWDYAQRASPLIVQDRYHMSEIVYAHARGDSSRLTPERYRFLDGWLRVNAALFTVVLTADPGLLSLRMQPDEMYGLSTIVDANEGFLEVVEGHYGSYKPDWDMHFHLTVTEPFIEPRDVEQIYTNYTERMDQWITFHQRRRVWLQS